MAIVTDEQFQRALWAANPWRSDSGVRAAGSPPYRRPAFQSTLDILEDAGPRRLPLLSGPRGAGKTTILFQLIDHLLDSETDPRRILYLPFDHALFRLSPADLSVERHMSMFPTSSGPRYLFLDEIEHASDWEKLRLEVLRDRKPPPRVVASASAGPVPKSAASGDRAGGVCKIRVPTLSFFEYCELLGFRMELPDAGKTPRLSELTPNRLAELAFRFEPLEPHFHRFLLTGGFPEAASQNDGRLAADVAAEALARDALALFPVRRPILMERLLSYLAIRSGSVFNASAAAKDLDQISVATVESYVRALETSHLIYRSYPVRVSEKSVRKFRPRIYVADPGIRNAVLTLDALASAPEDWGIAAETAVYKQVRSYCQQFPARAGYYREAKNSRKGIDLILERPGSRVAIQVSYADETRLKDSDAIVNLSRTPGQIDEAYLITKSLRDFGVRSVEGDADIRKIPAGLFLYLLGRAEANREQIL